MCPDSMKKSSGMKICWPQQLHADQALEIFEDECNQSPMHSYCDLIQMTLFVLQRVIC